MLELVRPLRGILQIKAVNTTDLVWRLHCRVTVYLLLFAALLLSARQYFGNPIDCVAGSGDVAISTMNDFCWIMGTYISKDPNFVLESTDLVKINAKIGHIPEEERSYQKYYQWVVFILAFQACLLTLPNVLWKIWEGGRLEALCEGLTTPILPEQWKQSSKKKLIRYLTTECRTHHRGYMYRYCFCTMLNFANVLANILLMNTLFSGFWMNYHPAMMALLSFDFPSWNRYNSQVFPKLAKCDFHFVGPSGSKQNRDGLCLLPLNVVNEKIFAFLWLWFGILGVISALNLLFWCALLCSKGIRAWLLRLQMQPIRSVVVSNALRGECIGKWFLLLQLCRNLNPLVSRDIMFCISKKRHPESLYSKPKSMMMTADFYQDQDGDLEIGEVNV
ncbi:innexin inx2 [Anopheles darlingi]|uniref:innexin inx2 n=1 Tax=Anopheles darlingi TaxID=43151 RepID=UPI002100654B|nr:innexin inx2 [Anopheles darlingi]